MIMMAPLCSLVVILSFLGAEATQHLSRSPHVGIWLDHTALYNSSIHNVSLSDYRAMSQVITEQFGTVMLNSAPSLRKWPTRSREGPHFVWLPTLVAELNKNRTSSFNRLPPLKVIVSFDNTEIRGAGVLSSFDVALRMADEANAVFEGTVETFLFHMNERPEDKKEGLRKDLVFHGLTELDQLRHASRLLKRTNVNRHDYKLGALADLDECQTYNEPISKLCNYCIKTLTEYLDILYLYTRYDPAWDLPGVPYRDPSKWSYKPSRTWLEICESEVKMPVVPLVVPQPGDDTLNHFGAVQHWSRVFGRDAIVYEAFDEFATGGRVQNWRKPRSQGWWRLVPQWRPGQELTPHMFVDKSQTWKDWKLKTGSATRGYFGKEETQRDMKKRYNGITVIFDPRVVPSHIKTITNAELIRMVELVASRFKTIIVEPTRHRYTQFEKLPEIIAEYNSVHDTDLRLRVVISFRVSNLDDFHKAKQLADGANAIRSGTVDRLAFHRFKDYETYSNEILRTSSEVNRAYRLSTFMDSWRCKNLTSLRIPTVGNPESEFLPYLSTIYLDMSTLSERRGYKVVGELQKLIDEFRECERKLKKEKSSLQVFPALGYVATGPVLQDAWMWMNEWAEANKDEQVVMFSAFDQVHHPHEPVGWWRLKNQTEEITWKSFEEKAFVVPKRKSWFSRSGSSSMATNIVQTWTLAVVFALLQNRCAFLCHFS